MRHWRLIDWPIFSSDKLLIDFFEFNRKPAEILLTDCYVQKQFASRCLLFNVSKLDINDFFSQHPRFVGINNEQVYREMSNSFNQWFITLFFQIKFRAIYSGFNGYCVEEQKRTELIQTSKVELFEKLVKRFRNIKYFCNNLHLRCLTGFEYTSEVYLFCKYPGIYLAEFLFAKVLAVIL